MGVRGVIFDCDGVLADTEATAEAVGLELLAEKGLEYTPEGFRKRFLGLGGALWAAAIDEDFRRQLGRGAPRDLWPRLRLAITSAIVKDVRPVPGMPDLVRSVRAEKAVASSSPRNELMAKVAALGLEGQFSGGCWSGDDVALTKPEPDLYHAAVRALDLHPDRCLAIEDSPNGVLAARAAGLRVIGFVGASPEPHEDGARLAAAGACALAHDAAEAAGLFQAEGVVLSAMVLASGGRR